MNPKILIAEDNPNVREIMRTALTGFRYDVMLAANGQEAVKTAGSHSPQLILMDLTLPELDGIEAARRIRKNPRMRSVPIIAITATFGPEIRRKCLESGFDDFISKPFSLAALKSIVEKSLKKQSM